jgi:hypothetical protein
MVITKLSNGGSDAAPDHPAKDPRPAENIHGAEDPRQPSDARQGPNSDGRRAPRSEQGRLGAPRPDEREAKS